MEISTTRTGGKVRVRVSPAYLFPPTPIPNTQIIPKRDGRARCWGLGDGGESLSMSRRMSRYREGGAGADVTTNHLEARCIVENLRAGVGTLLHADSFEDAPPFTSTPSSRGVSALTSTDLHFLATRAGARLLALANGKPCHKRYVTQHGLNTSLPTPL